MQRKTIEQGNMTLQEMLRQFRKDAGKYEKDMLMIRQKCALCCAFRENMIQ
ncbi:hypothetical protein [Butyrivibrio sp. YAB3001]|uniref:hypothetical protein n=1 Tax=Butyrivibrio sp. YAB3001 TaxID=1520812 RepID=UPI0008F6846F|nr:hypothetical protein [Butyrivibrio sp. YAB3001]SFD12823.1 hypothetical protein SAMN02910398_04140 [Butyrivibrio sp. YAB3001]SFD13156.1 hypothetical protein SAMN02910398_04146 [Butyrivibrio sp. YAB3001]